MRTYKLTVFEKTGERIVEETITAETDAQATEQGRALLEEKSLLDKTHRLVSPEAKLLLFHS